MQTTTLNASALSQLRSTGSSSAWSAELWKDYRQIRKPVGSIMLGLVAVQMLLLLAGWFLVPRTEHDNFLGMMVTIALLSPVLVTIACAGMLIGHERQTGTWGWNSVLPHSWKQSLGCKLLVTVTSTAAVLLFLSILPMIEYLSSGRAANDRWDPAILWMAGILVADCMAFYFLSLLLFRDSLTGLLVATGALLLMQLMAASTPLFISGNTVTQLDSDYSWWVLTISLPVLVLGFVAMTATFRWRWGVGQSATFGLSTSHAAVEAPIQALRRDNLSPGELPMLLNLSWRNYLTLRVCIALGLAAIALYGHPTILGWVGLACLVYGITAFDGDQNRARFRFLADRGVSWKKMVTSRLIVPLAFVIVACAIALLAALANYRMGVLLESVNLFAGASAACISLVLFLLGALTSLCFDKTIISVTVAFCVTAAIACLGTVLNEALYNYADVNPAWWLLYATVLFVLISIPLFAISIYSFAKIWLIEDRPRLGRRLVRTVVLATLPPALLPIGFGFLATPKVQWQGISPTDAVQKANLPVLAPAALMPSGPIFSGLESALPAYNGDETIFARVQQSIDGRIAGDEIFESQGAVAVFEERLASLETELQDSSSTSVAKTAESIENLRLLLLESAAVVTYMSDQGEYSVAQRALQTHHQLQELAAKYAAPDTIYARVNSFKLLRLQIQDWEKLGAHAELSQLLSPNLFDSQSQLILFVKKNGEAMRENLRSEVSFSTQRSNGIPMAVRLVPTLRWRQERQFALGIQHAIEIIEGKRSFTEPDVVTYWFLPEYFAYNELARERTLILNDLSVEHAE